MGWRLERLAAEAAILAFEPCNENHAVTEVVFAVVGLQGFTTDDRSSVKAAHPKWQGLLPSLQEEGVFIAVAAPDAALPPRPVAPLAFARFRADGEVDWRLLLTRDALVVNCCSYTRWNDVWTVVRGLFAEVAGSLRSQEQKIKSITLEHVHIFRSTGDRYDARDLLQESESVPPGIFARGPTWHLHQGWFVDAERPVSGRVLRRMHIDSMVEDGRPQARVGTSHRFDVRDAPDLKSMFAEPETLIDSLFSCLHTSNKALLADFLTAEMARRIDIHAY